MTTNNLPVKVIPREVAPVRRHQEKFDELFETLSAFESETAAVLVKTSPKRDRPILYALVAMVAVCVALSAVVKLDRVVTGGGKILSVGGPLYVSPLNAGVVREVRVKAGDIVKKGQVLAELDPTLTGADVAQLKQKVGQDEATIERLTAELNDQPYVPSKQNDSATLQMSIWRQRNAEYNSNLATLDAAVMSATASVNQYEHDSEQYRKRYELAQSREKMFDPLSKKGYVSQLQLSQLEDATQEAKRVYSQANSQLAVARQALAGARSQRNAYTQKWHSDVGALLAATQTDYTAAQQGLEKAQKLLDLGTLVAPADAIVLKVGKVSTGAIATTLNSDYSDPQLFTLSPLDAPLEAEIAVSTASVGFIRPGDPVTLKLDAYQFIRHGSAKGVIKTISEGSFTTDDNNQPTAPYFKVRVAITEAKLRDVPPDFRLIPGMTLAGDVMVGRRTILEYLLEGSLRTGSEAMREAQ